MCTKISAQFDDCTPLIQYALEGNSNAQKELFLRLNPIISDLAFIMLKGHPNFIVHDDVVGQMWENFLTSTRPFEPEESPDAAYQYFRDLLKNSIRQIAAKYTPPGQKTRPEPTSRKAKNEEALSYSGVYEQAHQYFRDLYENVIMQSATDGLPKDQKTELKGTPSPTGTYDHTYENSITTISVEQDLPTEGLPIEYAHHVLPKVENKLDAAIIMDLAPVSVRQFLEMVHWEGYSQTDAAKVMEMPRQTIDSRTKRFIHVMRDYVRNSIAS